MSLARTNLTNFIVTHSCAFAGGAPLVAAPVVRQSTQHFWPHNWISWTPGTDYGWLGGAIALRTSFVEGQAPLLDAGFFSWFFDKLEDTAPRAAPRKCERPVVHTHTQFRERACFACGSR